MRDILPDLDRWRRDNETIALATLVSARGSTPRLPGARLGVTRSGKMTGSVSGGCVESDVFEHAMQVLDAGAPRVVNYGVTDEDAIRVGLSCGGSIDVLIEPFATTDAWRAIEEAIAHERSAVLAIGLSPAPLLARKLAVRDDGSLVGSVDPRVDAEVSAEARRLLARGGTQILNVSWQGDEARVFLEAFSPPLRLFIVGATHTATVLCRLAKPLGFRVTVIDPRGLYATPERFANADELLHERPEEVLDRTALDARSYVVVLTHDPKFDIPTLTRALRSEARYIGIMSNRRTYAHRKAQLVREGFSEAELIRIRAPIGLDLGGRNPEEMALAIVAEMVAVRYGRDGRPLAATDEPIHGDS